MKNTHLTDTRFINLELSKPILQGLKAAGFDYCSPIQDRSLPIALRDRDVAGQAQTGTGKTASFLLATFQRLINTQNEDDDEEKKFPRALILAPTRELAIQIHKDAQLLGKYLGFKFALIYGGTDYKQQQRTVQSQPDIIIATPGRLIDFYRQKSFSLNFIEVMVMDEADRMFDLGFIKDIRFLFSRMPPPEKRLNLLFSATLSFKVSELAYEHMNQPVMIKIANEKMTSSSINQFAFCPANEQKIPLLIGLIQSHKPTRSIIFVNTKIVAESLADHLNENDYKTALLSGDVPQTTRQKLLTDFQENKVTIMIATDVAARGLHISDVSHVFNFDLPQDPEDYVHRIGRTARFGSQGEAISFICEEYAYSMPDIETYIKHKVDIVKITPDLLSDIKIPKLKPRKSRKAYSPAKKHRPS